MLSALVFLMLPGCMLFNSLHSFDTRSAVSRESGPRKLPVGAAASCSAPSPLQECVRGQRPPCDACAGAKGLSQSSSSSPACIFARVLRCQSARSFLRRATQSGIARLSTRLFRLWKTQSGHWCAAHLLPHLRHPMPCASSLGPLPTLNPVVSVALQVWQSNSHR